MILVFNMALALEHFCDLVVIGIGRLFLKLCGRSTMRRTLLLLALLLLTALPALAQAPMSARVAQVDTSAYPTVKLYVSVTDSAGKPLPGLTARDFTITEDQQPVKIDSFVGGGAGAINTMLVIDRSGSM